MITPMDEAGLAGAVAGAQGPLAVQGGGTRAISGAGTVLSVAGLRGIELYEPGALTLVAAAGTPLAEIAAVLAGGKQRLAFEPPDMRGLLGSAGESTIGGVVAGNASGPRRIQAGAARDFLLGVRFVDGHGRVIRNGGRVMKNVTGYDLVKLMAGSWGTLGVLSQVALKVLPVAETEATLRIAGLGPEAAVAAMSRALGSPFDVTGAAHLVQGPGGDPVTLLRIEGFGGSVAYRAGRLRDLLAGFGDIDIEDDPGRGAAIWARVRDVAPFHGVSGDVWRLSVKPSDAPGVAARLEAKALLFDWGGGLIWALMAEGSDLRARAGVFAGHATLVRGSAETRARLGVFHPLPAPLAAISAGLRARFDPRGLFNPGLMGG
jgi:glycolate oxidase FAD binding subunit